MVQVKAKKKEVQSHSYKVNDVSIEFDQSENKPVIKVTFDILADDKIVDSRILSFSEGTPTKDIHSDLAKVAQVYFSDQEDAKKAESQEKLTKQANELADTLVGKTVKL